MIVKKIQIFEINQIVIFKANRLMVHDLLVLDDGLAPYLFLPLVPVAIKRKIRIIIPIIGIKIIEI